MTKSLNARCGFDLYFPEDTSSIDAELCRLIAELATMPPAQTTPPRKSGKWTVKEQKALKAQRREAKRAARTKK